MNYWIDLNDVKYSKYRDYWINLNDSEYKEMWDRFYKKFNFNPSTDRKDFPSFKEPSPFITYDISNNYEVSTIDEWYKIVLKVLKECTGKEEFIYALDWQHDSFLYNPHFQNEEDSWVIEPFPNGDYYIFIPNDMRWGILTQPWEETICIYGKDLIDSFSRHNPKMLQTIKRYG